MTPFTLWRASTTTVRPSASESPGVISRAAKSDGPPGGEGTKSRIGRFVSCANAPPASASNSSNPNALVRTFDIRLPTFDLGLEPRQQPQRVAALDRRKVGRAEAVASQTLVFLGSGTEREVGAVDDVRDRDDPAQRIERARMVSLGSVVVEPLQLVDHSLGRHILRLLLIDQVPLEARTQERRHSAA